MAQRPQPVVLSDAYESDPNNLYDTMSGTAFNHSSQQIDDTLLEAVTSAAGADLRGGVAVSGSLSSPRNSDMQHQEAAEEAVSLLEPPQTPGKNKRKRGSVGAATRQSDAAQHQFNFRNDPSVTMLSPQKMPKTKKQSKPSSQPNSADMATQNPGAEEHNSSGADVEKSTSANDTSVFFSEYMSPLNVADARASGVYSAAALFRKPTDASRKYTRPPMSKLFSSLELTPENFIHLQSAAKGYMLDPEHEERRHCVGNRAKMAKFDDSKGDTDMTKLRLYHCVKEFLETDDVGERYFGKQSEGAERRDWFWPRDVNKVISLMTPLLRRMITNERQRQYARETRKAPSSGGGKDGEHASPEAVGEEKRDSTAADFSQSESQELSPQLDPQLAVQDKVETRSTDVSSAPVSLLDAQSAGGTRDPLQWLRFAVIRNAGPGVKQQQPRRFLHSFKRKYHGQDIGQVLSEAQAAEDRFIAETGEKGVRSDDKPSKGKGEQQRWVLWALLDTGRKRINTRADWTDTVEITETRMPYIDGELTLVVELLTSPNVTTHKEECSK